MVVLTLVVNAPLLPILVDWTGLAEVSAVKARIRAKAVRALLRYTKAAIYDLQHDEDEMLRGEPCQSCKRPLMPCQVARAGPAANTALFGAVWNGAVRVVSGVAGVDWKTIRQEVDMSVKLGHLMTGPSGKQARKAYVRSPSAVHTSHTARHHKEYRPVHQPCGGERNVG